MKGFIAASCLLILVAAATQAGEGVEASPAVPLPKSFSLQGSLSEARRTNHELIPWPTMPVGDIAVPRPSGYVTVAPLRVLAYPFVASYVIIRDVTGADGPPAR